MSGGIFITGTDTGVGKTRAALFMMDVLQRRGLRVVGMKPVATGATWHQGRLVNDDALALQRAGSLPLPYGKINPFVYAPPTAPHIAAAHTGQPIDIARIVEKFLELRESAEVVVVEGAGGWKVPLGSGLAMDDLARALGLPVLLVVGLRLGCLNHAALTRAAIAQSGARFSGWIANRLVQDFPDVAETLDTLESELGCRPLAVLPHRAEPGGFSDVEVCRWGLDEILRGLTS
ncbi:dethiobiotin synthase [Candidatus Methylocalor cossyra]|uniref:ATP-dependent dethiobiotin synthetase BioD n=1 Tax=Candidatus Methylocalor cossyra TaxID=3108543 RepID=A0ABP1C5I4_9GAMM